MNETTLTPDPDLIYSLYTGIFKPQMIRMALLLDVFAPLAEGPLDAAAVAQACGCDPFGMSALLDYLSSLNLLTRQDDTYALTPTAATFLVPEKRTYVGDLVLGYTATVMWDSVLQALRSGRPVPFEEEALFAQDAWLESYSAWRVPNSLEMWKAAGVEPECGSRLRVLDIACGCAIKSLVLAARSRAVRVTCLDRPVVLAAARDLAERMEVLSQVTFVPENLLTADLGRAQYEACLLGQITQYLTEEQNRELFGRIRTALVRDGLLVVDCPMATDQPDESTSFLTLVLWANGGGAAHAFETYREWLKSAGFRQVTQLSKRWLSATK
jgi:hypothetical protein